MEPCTTAVTGESLVDLLQQMRPRIKQILFRYHIPPEEAEDLVQETVLAALARWDQIRDREAWLVGTLSNRCAVYWRRQLTQRRVQGLSPAQLEELSEPQDPPQMRALSLRDLSRLMTVLPERQRQVLLLLFGRGLSQLEVADLLGYRPESVRKIVQRALQRLKRAAETGRDECRG